MVLILLLSVEGFCSHIVGGEATYAFQKDTIVAGREFYKYIVSITIYEDCQNGQPGAIAADNPAIFALYDTSGTLLDVDDSVNYDTSYLVPTNFNNLCLTDPPAVCLLKKTFKKTYYLSPSPKGYVVAYQRCCRNAAIINVFDPGDIGATYYCRIPSTAIASHNSSAIFKNYPPQIICINNPLIYDHSAIDADGDSLTYEFCPSLIGASADSIKPIPSPPPYALVTYVPPFTYLHPMTGSPAIQINTTTGLITGTPNSLGRYLVTVCCHEWRNGILINTVTREFQFVVTNCSKSVIADIPQYSTDPNTYEIDCKNYTIGFVNTSKGGTTYHWDFGVASNPFDTSALFEPTYTYPDTGTYVVRLNVNPNSTCGDSIWRYVKVYPYFIANFADSGLLCPNMPLKFNDQSFSTFYPTNTWIWAFGDGTFSTQQDLFHTYSVGGTYNVTLIATNTKDCSDTSLKQVVIEIFKPFAGDDTIIVKGSSIQFDGQGGISYAWTPGYYLSDTGTADPVGYYPDTGTFTYYVYVKSEYGCKGYDTLKVQVVGSASFFVPTAFTPNGDGENDYFRPVAIGYRELNYLKVFNRWGQMVYYSRNFETGWDGTFNGKRVEIGTYFWEVGYTDRFGKPGSTKGDVTLLR